MVKIVFSLLLTTGQVPNEVCLGVEKMDGGITNSRSSRGCYHHLEDAALILVLVHGSKCVQQHTLVQVLVH